MKKALLALLLISPVANAGYVGLGIGYGSVDIDTSGSGAFDSVIVDDKSFTTDFFIGKSLSEHLSIEGGFINLGEATVDIYDTDAGIYVEAHSKSSAESLYLSGVGKLPFNDTVTGFARIGLNRWDADITESAYATDGVTSITDAGSGSDTSISPMFGLGVEITPFERVAFRYSFTRFKDVAKDLRVTYSDGSSFQSDGSDVDVNQLAVTYAF